MPGISPGPSIKNPRVYEALRREGMSKQRAARISNAQARRRKAMGECSCALKESLGPGITRIRGNLCNVHGRYGPCDAAQSGKKPPKPKKGRAGRAAKKPVKTPEQRRQERTAVQSAAQAKNRESVAQALADADASLGPTGVAAVLAAADGGPIENGPELEKLGYAEKNPDGSYRLTAVAREFAHAANRGDTRAALDADGRAQSHAAKLGAIKPAKPEKPAKGGGGGGKKDDPKKAQAQAQREQEHTADRAQRAQDRADRIAERRQAAQERTARQAERDQAALERTRVTTPELADAARKLSTGETLGKADVAALVRNGLARQAKDGTVSLTSTGLRATRQKATKAVAHWNGMSWVADSVALAERYQVQSTLQVYKDTSGDDRWLLVSSTAYRDRDKEIVSTKALGGAVALADASGYRGPLRFWHVPGVELGDCDFQATAQDGRFLIESGTFRGPALAAAVKAKADRYQISIGFTHPANEPDGEGVFHHIAIFERSLVPRGRAANPFTQVLVTKEQRMLTDEKQTELKELTKDAPGLLEQLLANITTTDKAAQADGATYKDDLRAIIREELASLLSAKAAPPPPPPEAPAAEMPIEAKADLVDEGADVGMEPEGDENMLNPAEIAAIAQAVVEALGPALNIESKMAGHLNEMKGLIGGMATTKDTQIAEVKTELEKVKTQVADLTGSQPRILAGGYRASQAQATITTDETKIKESVPSADPVVQSFGAFMQDMGFGGPAQPGA